MYRLVHPIPPTVLRKEKDAVTEGFALGLAWLIFLTMLASLAFLLLRGDR